MNPSMRYFPGTILMEAAVFAEMIALTLAADTTSRFYRVVGPASSVVNRVRR
jgi:hypothetical protein